MSGMSSNTMLWSRQSTHAEYALATASGPSSMKIYRTVVLWQCLGEVCTFLAYTARQIVFEHQAGSGQWMLGLSCV